MCWREWRKDFAPRGESDTFGDTQSARADSAPTPAARDGAYPTEDILNTSHSPQFAPTARPGAETNQSFRITEIIDFYLPAPPSNSHPEVSGPARAIAWPLRFFYFVSATLQGSYSLAGCRKGRG